MLELTYEEVIQATGAELLGELPDRRAHFPAVSIDTRTIQPGEAFFAIEGENLDGHDFIEDAVSKGVSALVVSRPIKVPSGFTGCTLLRVKNTTAALQNLAHYARVAWSGPLIAITGSMGKTTTRVFTATLLSQRFNVLQSPANFNNEFGVPLSLLQLKTTHKMAVLELGMNHPGEIRELGRICLPDAAVITNVAPVHLEFFNSVDHIARAKEEVLECLPEGGTFYLNRDDTRVVQMAERYTLETVSFGFNENADFKITYFSLLSPSEMEFEIKTPDRYFRVSVPFAGKHHLYNIAAAVAVATLNGLTWQEIDAGLSLLRTLPKRGQLLNIADVTIWDESYNSNPAAADCLLDTVAELPRFKRIILTLGDMLELGEDSLELHYRLGQKVPTLRPDWLLTVGGFSEKIRAGAIDAGMQSERCFHFEKADLAAQFLQKNLRSGDLLILKGSRGIQLDQIIDTLRRARF
jgi:UDP-N-acetylmuramoyl-tripeptide--D-alanyl-D-alanine ligase